MEINPSDFVISQFQAPDCLHCSAVKVLSKLGVMSNLDQNNTVHYCTSSKSNKSPLKVAIQHFSGEDRNKNTA